jgi:hypothetical protein
VRTKPDPHGSQQVKENRQVLPVPALWPTVVSLETAFTTKMNAKAVELENYRYRCKNPDSQEAFIRP